MDFIFVDETGDTGSLPGSSRHFGMALLHTNSESFPAVRRLLTLVRWPFSLYTELKLDAGSRITRKILEGLAELAGAGMVWTTGLCLLKESYNGRYLRWCDLPIPKDEWPLYLRNYVLRHLLEWHFSDTPSSSNQIDLIMDRISLSEQQRSNLLDYLNSRPPIPLARPFRIPSLTYLTVADSRYVGGLQVAHELAEVLKALAARQADEELAALSSFFRVACFLGMPEPKNR